VKLEDLSHVLILAKTEGLGCLPPYSLRNKEGLGVLSLPILLKIEERCCGVDGCNLLNTEDFGLDLALSPLPFPASSAMTCCASYCYLYAKIFTGWGGLYP